MLIGPVGVFREIGSSGRARVALSIAIAATVASTVSAQESGQVGISMGYPGSIGLVWHVTDRLAVRPDFIFRGTSIDSNSADQSSTNVGFGISGLFYLSRNDHLGIYVSPRYAYTHTSSDTEQDLFANLSPAERLLLGPLPTTFTSHTTTTTHSFSGSVGAQYALHRRFSVFGEAGFGYSTSDLSTQLNASLPIVFQPPSTDGPTTWGSQTAVGVILYFRD